MPACFSTRAVNVARADTGRYRLRPYTRSSITIGIPTHPIRYSSPRDRNIPTPGTVDGRVPCNPTHASSPCRCTGPPTISSARGSGGTRSLVLACCMTAGVLPCGHLRCTVMRFCVARHSCAHLIRTRYECRDALPLSEQISTDD